MGRRIGHQERPFSTLVCPKRRTFVLSGSVDELSVDKFRLALYECVNARPESSATWTVPQRGP